MPAQDPIWLCGRRLLASSWPALVFVFIFILGKKAVQIDKASLEERTLLDTIKADPNTKNSTDTQLDNGWRYMAQDLRFAQS